MTIKANYWLMISDPCEKTPEFDIFRVFRTRKYIKFGTFLCMAEQLPYIIQMKKFNWAFV